MLPPSGTISTSEKVDNSWRMPAGRKRQRSSSASCGNTLGQQDPPARLQNAVNLRKHKARVRGILQHLSAQNQIKPLAGKWNPLRIRNQVDQRRSPEINR